MADDRGMMVGAREARLANSVGVRPDREKGVVERGGSVEATAVVGETGLPGVGLRGDFSSIDDRFRLSCSEIISPVLVVLLFVPV